MVLLSPTRRSGLKCADSPSTGSQARRDGRPGWCPMKNTFRSHLRRPLAPATTSLVAPAVLLEGLRTRVAGQTPPIRPAEGDRPRPGAVFSAHSFRHPPKSKAHSLQPFTSVHRHPQLWHHNETSSMHGKTLPLIHPTILILATHAQMARITTTPSRPGIIARRWLRRRSSRSSYRTKISSRTDTLRILRLYLFTDDGWIASLAPHLLGSLRRSLGFPLVSLLLLPLSRLTFLVFSVLVL